MVYTAIPYMVLVNLLISLVDKVPYLCPVPFLPGCEINTTLPNGGGSSDIPLDIDLIDYQPGARDIRGTPENGMTRPGKRHVLDGNDQNGRRTFTVRESGEQKDYDTQGFIIWDWDNPSTEQKALVGGDITGIWKDDMGLWTAPKLDLDGACWSPNGTVIGWDALGESVVFGKWALDILIGAGCDQQNSSHGEVTINNPPTVMPLEITPTPSHTVAINDVPASDASVPVHAVSMEGVLAPVGAVSVYGVLVPAVAIAIDAV